MNLERTKALIHDGIDRSDPNQSLLNLLESTIELLNIEGNDFIWSSWNSSEEAIAEIQKIKESILSGVLPPNLEVSVLFAPTGPIQEVSLSSGWADTFLKIAERFDEIENLLWK
ncbi:hypothetical protein [Pelagicoccus albus]|uniref:Uncharacterized protein n=1 Tax=Pelagicoccus albus TaxID=415222 RepID=A0A7X1E8I5_9BACT|nr:hypothetical protein [Pelagicoccus albus]MBC2606306.1 hypothetical protein [Pelagicoccus albus]